MEYGYLISQLRRRSGKTVFGPLTNYRTQFQGHKNVYPIIYFDFKDLDAKDFNRFLGKLRQKLSDLYSGYGYLPDSDELDRKDVSNYNDIP